MATTHLSSRHSSKFFFLYWEDKERVMTSEEMRKRTEAIIEEMDRRGISDKPLRKAVGQVQKESVAKMQEYEEKLETVGDRGSYSKTAVERYP